MGVSTFTQPDLTSQLETPYKTAIDDSVAVLKHGWGTLFAPHEQATGSPQPDMTVELDAGLVFTEAAVPTVVAAQSTAVITAPASNPRKDIVYIDATTGAVGVATGSEGASPSDPAIPAGKIAIARVTLATSTTAITNSLIDDLRGGHLAPGLARYLQLNKATYAAAVSGSPTGSEYAVTLAPAIAAYADGLAFWAEFDEENEGQPIVTVNGLARVGLFDQNLTAVADGAIKARSKHLLVWSDDVGLGSPQEGGFIVATLKAAAAASGTWTYGTETPTTSGTAIDAAGLPSGVVDLEILLNAVSWSDTSNGLLQLGDAGGLETTGYESQAVELAPDATVSESLESTAGFIINQQGAAAPYRGKIVLTRIDASDFLWHCEFQFLLAAGGYITVGAGYKALSGEVDRFRLTTDASGTFDAGSLNYRYRTA